MATEPNQCVVFARGASGAEEHTIRLGAFRWVLRGSRAGRWVHKWNGSRLGWAHAEMAAAALAKVMGIDHEAAYGIMMAIGVRRPGGSDGDHYDR